LAELPFLTGEHGRGPFLVFLFFISVGIVIVSGIWEGTLPRSEEAVFAETAREVVVTGDCLTMHFDGEPVYDTPPLPACFTALFIRIFGNHVFAVRLPFVVFAFLTLYLIYLVAGITAGGEPFSGEWITQARALGLLSAVILAASPIFGKYAPQVTPELSFTFFVVLALLGWLSLPERSSGLLLWGAGLAGGLLSIGAGGLLVIPGSLLALITDRRRRVLWRSPGFLLATLAGLVVGCSWLVWTTGQAAGGTGELWALLAGFSGPSGGDLLSSLRELWLRSLPWAIPATAAVFRILFLRKGSLRRGGLSGADDTLLCFSAVLFVAIALSHPLRIAAYLPLVPLCAVISAREIARWTAGAAETAAGAHAAGTAGGGGDVMGIGGRELDRGLQKLWSFNQAMTAIFCLLMLLLAATPMRLHERRFDPIEDIARTAASLTPEGTRLGNFRQDYRTQSARMLFYGNRALDRPLTSPREVAAVLEREPEKVFFSMATDLDLLRKSAGFPSRLNIRYRAGELVLFGLAPHWLGDQKAAEGQ
jgi:4-amino-4-deoxy-L-arabinose transferase-like glycosyltransferase